MGTKNILCKIIWILIIILLIDSIAPILNSNANVFDAITNWIADSVFEAIAQLLADLGDIVIEALQNIFITLDPIHINGTRYVIKYSPGIIFSGNVPALDVNFINPGKTEESYLYYNTVEEFVQRRSQKGEDVLDDIEIGEWKGNHVFLGVSGFSADGAEVGGAEQYFTLYGGPFTITGKTLYDLIDDSHLEQLVKSFFTNGYQSGYVDTLYNSSTEFNNCIHAKLNDYGMQGAYYYEDEKYDIGSVEINGLKYELYYYALADFYVELHSTYNNTDEVIVTFNGENGQIMGSEEILTDEDLQLRVKENMVQKIIDDVSVDDAEVNKIKQEIIEAISQKIEIKEQKSYESSANKLRDTIATWYKVMRNIALVGLLSVLVYVAIRMIISSVAEDKAKYKKMLGDWVAAICILFVLQFIMSLLFTVTQAINDVFNSSIIGENGEDILLSNIRNQIENYGVTGFAAFANTVIYLVLIILTVMFTFQYFKRFIYVAFLTMIAPLIALTYPLDKIKDGHAQAFSMWLREYIFSVLIQPVHLIIYYIILGVSSDLAVSNPVYAIVAISFILPAEKFIRKMFGFDKAEAVNTLGSAAGGAAVMNAINKLGAKGPKGKPKGEPATGGNKGEKIRTANEGAGDPYEALRNQGTGGDNGGAGNVGGGANAPARQANQAGTGQGRTNVNQGQQALAGSHGATGAGQGSKNAGKRSIKDGAKTLWN
ncbi:MAG: hypothetical protein ACI4VP_03525, partial [Clostridia bacterium]